MEDYLALAFALVMTTLVLGGIALIVAREVYQHVRTQAPLRARRAQAWLEGPIGRGGPFELLGSFTRGGTCTLHLDLDIQVIGGADVEATFRSCGVRLAYEIQIDGMRVGGRETKLPADSTRIGPSVKATDNMFPSQRTCVVCTLPIETVTVAPGSRVHVRGQMTPLPSNEVNAATLWFG